MGPKETPSPMENSDDLNNYEINNNKWHYYYYYYYSTAACEVLVSRHVCIAWVVHTIHYIVWTLDIQELGGVQKLTSPCSIRHLVQEIQVIVKWQYCGVNVETVGKSLSFAKKKRGQVLVISLVPIGLILSSRTHDLRQKDHNFLTCLAEFYKYVTRGYHSSAIFRSWNGLQQASQ
jgi:hypothetical protein